MGEALPDIRIIDGRAPVDDLGVLMFEIILGIKRPKGFTTAQALAAMPADDAARCRRAGKLIASMIEQALDLDGPRRPRRAG